MPQNLLVLNKVNFENTTDWECIIAQKYNISPQTISMNVGTYNKQNNQIYLLHKLLFKNEGYI